MHIKESPANLNEESNQTAKKTASMKNVRVVKKNLVYIVGLHADHANFKTLNQPEALAKYGEILKLVLNNDKPFNRESSEQQIFSAYVTYSDEIAASFAITALTGFEYKNVQLKANFGMTKYCSYFMKGSDCLNNDCLFLHHVAEPEDTYSKVWLLGRLNIRQNDYQH